MGYDTKGATKMNSLHLTCKRPITLILSRVTPPCFALSKQSFSDAQYKLYSLYFLPLPIFFGRISDFIYLGSQRVLFLSLMQLLPRGPRSNSVYLVLNLECKRVPSMCWVQNQNLWHLAWKKTNEKFIWDIMNSDDRLQDYNLLSVCTRWLNPMILFIAVTPSYVGNLPIASNFFVKNIGRLWDYTTKRRDKVEPGSNQGLQTCKPVSYVTALTYRFPQNHPVTWKPRFLSIQHLCQWLLLWHFSENVM